MGSRVASRIASDRLPSHWGRPETLFALWVALALISLPLVATLLDTALPVFTVIWLAVPTIAVLMSKDAGSVGFRKVPLHDFVRVTAINVALVLLISMLVEPWSHAYTRLLEVVRTSQPQDSTFAWLVRYDGLAGWGGMVLFSGLVTMFAEELFFRGWLLQLLLRHVTQWWAIAIQAALFTVPQLLVTLTMSPVQAAVYALGYSWLAIGFVGGWAAARTGSIWPSLTAAVLLNVVMCLGLTWTA